MRVSSSNASFLINTIGKLVPAFAATKADDGTLRCATWSVDLGCCGLLDGADGACCTLQGRSRGLQR